MAPPLFDTFIVPEVPGVLYALFDYGLTVERKILPINFLNIKFTSFYKRALKKSIHTEIFSMNRLLIYNFIQEAQVITMKFQAF